MSLTLAACGPSSNLPPPQANVEVTQRQIPDAPDFLKEVQVKDPEPGEDPLVVAARERAGRVQANRIIRGQRVWHRNLQESLAQGQ